MSLRATTLNANAKASASKQRIRVLENPTTDQRAWLNDVARKAKLVGATHSIKIKWIPLDEVDLICDQDSADAADGGQMLNAALREGDEQKNPAFRDFGRVCMIHRPRRHTHTQAVCRISYFLGSSLGRMSKRQRQRS